MNNLGTLYRYELKKILYRRLTAVVLIALMFLTVAISAGEYIGGKKHAAEEEKALSGRPVDDLMLDEMREAVEPMTATTDDGEEMVIGAGIKDPAYEPLMDYLTTIGGNIEKAYNMTEAALEERFNSVIDEIIRDQYLTEDETVYWKTRQVRSPMPLTYGKIQNSWGDAVTIMYVVAILAMIAIAATLSGVFSDEMQLHTDSLIFASKNGRRRLVTAKLLAGITAGIMETVVILLTCVAAEFAISGFAGGDTSVQFFVGPTAMDMPVSRAFWIFAGIMLVIGLLMSMFAMCCSQIFRNSVAVIAVMMGLWLLSMLNPPYSWRFLSQACSYLPVTFLGGWTFSDYRMLGIFGHLFTILMIAPVLYLVLSLIMGRLTRISYYRYQVSK
jgi:hypothetical protein